MSGKTLTQEDKVLVEKAFALQNGDQAGVTISNSDTATLLERLGFDLDDNRINLQKPQYGLDELTEVRTCCVDVFKWTESSITLCDTLDTHLVPVQVVGAATSNVHEQRKLAHAFRIFTDKPLTSRLMSLPRLQQTLVS